jgi:hypothetical protein
MENGQGADARAKIAGIAGELLQGIGGSFHQEPVDFLRMGSCQGAEFRGKREGQQEVGTGQEMAALFFQPAFGLLLMTLRATAVATGNGELSITCLMGSAPLWGVDCPTPSLC